MCRFQVRRWKSLYQAVLYVQNAKRFLQHLCKCNPTYDRNKKDPPPFSALILMRHMKEEAPDEGCCASGSQYYVNPTMQWVHFSLINHPIGRYMRFTVTGLKLVCRLVSCVLFCCSCSSHRTKWSRSTSLE